MGSVEMLMQCLGIVFEIARVSVILVEVMFAGHSFLVSADFLPLLCATAQQSYCPHAGVRRPSAVRP